MLCLSSEGIDSLPRQEIVSVVGGGKSLDKTQSSITGYTIGCNKTALVMNTDMLHSMDMKFMKEAQDEIRQYQGDMVLSIRHEPAYTAFDNAIYVEQSRATKLSDDPKVTMGRNTGHSGLNVAYLLGAKEIHLFGIDMTGKHFHGGYKWNKIQKSDQSYLSWAKNFSQTVKQLKEKGIKVYHHVSEEIGSQVDCFERVYY